MKVKWKSAMVYLDNIVVFLKLAEERIDHIQLVQLLIYDVG